MKKEQCSARVSSGWVMRVYYKLEPGDGRGRSELCAAHCAFPHLDLCDVNDLPPPWGDLQASQQVREKDTFLIIFIFCFIIYLFIYLVNLFIYLFLMFDCALEIIGSLCNINSEFV